MKSNDAGFVYLLKNKSMPGLYKIGYTTQDVDLRVEQLSKATGVPTSFESIYSARFDWFTRPFTVEQMIHQKLGEIRVSNKEFFRFADDDQAINTTVFAMVSCCIDILSSDSGSEWLESNSNFPHGDTESMFLSSYFEGGSGFVLSDNELKIHRSDMLSSGDIERFAALECMSMIDVISGCVMLLELGYSKNIYEGIEIYLNKSRFFDRWLSKIGVNIRNTFSQDHASKELVH